MKMFKNASMLLAGLAALMLSVAAQAGTIDLKWNGWSHGTPKVVSITSGGNVYAGEFEFKDGGGNTYGLFCIDVTRHLNKDATYHVVNAASSTAITASELGNVAWLYDNHYASVTNSTSSAAFQLALWTIVEGVTVNSPTSGGVYDAMTAMLSGLSSKAQSSLYNIFVFTPKDENGRINGQILIGVTPVPEPGTLALLGLGLLGAGAIRRRRS